MEQLEFKAEVREARGRSKNRRLRREGKIPAVIYGAKTKPISVDLDWNEIQKKTRGSLPENTLMKILVKEKGKEKEKARTVLIKEIQRSALTGSVLHVDFNEIALDVKLRAKVPTVALGESKGVKEQGGVLEHVLYEVEVECLPADIPEKITIDVSPLTIGMSVRVKDLAVSDKVKILTDPELTVYAVAAPKAEEEVKPAAETAAATAAEPELSVQKGKKEEEAPAEGAAAEKGAEKGKAPEKGAAKPAEKKEEKK